MSNATQKYIIIQGKNFVTISGYAELKKVTRQTVYNWIKNGSPEGDPAIVVTRLLGRQLILIYTE